MYLPIFPIPINPILEKHRMLSDNINDIFVIILVNKRITVQNVQNLKTFRMFF